MQAYVDLVTPLMHMCKHTIVCTLQATFTAAAGVPRHPTKPGLKAKVNIPIFPDFSSWEDKYVTVNFEEGDPAQDSKTLAQVIANMSERAYAWCGESCRMQARPG